MGVTKKRRTSSESDDSFLYVLDAGKLYAIPRSVAAAYEVEVKRALARPQGIDASDVFDELTRERGKAASLLRGVRVRENLSQVEFAKLIDVTQANLSNMERGRRPIGKAIAKRIASAFDVDYRYFLE